MAIADLVSQETNLGGSLVTSLSSSDGNGSTFTVRFFDTKTKAARTPQSTTLDFIINRDNSRAERIRSSSHSTASGITTITIATNGRDIPLFGIGAGTTSGNTHRPGDSIGCVTQHEGVEQINNVIDGTTGTSAADFRIGDETASDTTVHFQNDQTTKPTIHYDDTDQRFMVNHGDDAAAAGEYSIHGMPQVTTAERTAFLNAKNGDMVYDTDTGIAYLWDGGAWADLQTGGASVPNAADGTAGLVDIATIAEIIAETDPDAGSAARNTITVSVTNATASRDDDTIIEDMSVVSGYGLVDDADAPALDISDYIEGVNSGSFTWTNVVGSGSWSNNGITGSPYDISALTGVASGTPTQGYIEFYIKPTDFSVLTAFSIFFGSSATDRISNNFVASLTTNTWTKIRIQLSAMTLIGTPDWTAVDYMAFDGSWTGSSGVLIDRVTITDGQNDSGFLPVLDTTGHVSANFIDNATEIQKGSVHIATDTEIEAGSITNTEGETLVASTKSKFVADDRSYTNVEAGENIDGTTTPQAVFISFNDGKLYRSDANDLPLLFFDGFVVDNVSSGDQTKLYRGSVEGFTGLTPGRQYFVSSTIGEITTPAPDGLSRLNVGLAVSATEVNVNLKEQSEIPIAKQSLIHVDLQNLIAVTAGAGATEATPAIGGCAALANGDDAFLYHTLSAFSGGAAPAAAYMLNWDNAIEVQWWGVITDTTDHDTFMGLHEDEPPAAVNANATDTDQHIGFYVADAALYASNGNGAAQDRTDVSAGLTLTDWNLYRIVWDGSSRILFYVNGTRVASHTATLPTGATTNGTDQMHLTFGVTSVDAGDDDKHLLIRNNVVMRAEFTS